jgi:hypothetical protein
LKDVSHLKEIHLPCEKLESPWMCDCRNCGEYQGGSCPLYGCMCKPDCRQDPPCTIERCVGYWPATDKFDKLAEDRLIMYLQRVSTPTANEIAPFFSKELLAQAYNKGLIQGVENGSRYDLGESTEEFYWRINHTPWTLAAVAKQNDRNGIGVYEPFEKWRLLMRHRKKAPTAIAPVELTAKPAKAKKSRATSRANRNRDLEALAPHGCLGTSPCLCHSCINQETCGQCKRMNKSVCGHYHAHTVECPAYSKAEGEGWTCSDCLCPKCANNGESCHTCEGPIYCSKHGGKMGGCPDFRAKDGEEQPTVPVKATKQPKPKKQPKLTRADYDNNPLPGSNADTCSHCDCETCGLNQAHLNYTDKEWANCPPCGCDQCLGKPELQPTTLCGRKAALTVDVLGNTESQLPMEQQHMVTLQRYVRQFCGECKCLTCGRAYQNCAMNGDEPYHICSICTLEHPHHHKPYPAIIKDCEHWIDKATFPADIYAPGQGPCPETACELRYNGEGGPCLCHSCKYGPGSCDTSCNIPGYPMETGQYGCEWYAKKEVATVDVVTQPAADPDVPDLVKVGDLVTPLHARGFVYDIRKVTRVERTDAGWQIYGDLWDDFRHPRRKLVSKDEPIIRYGVTGWKAEDGKVVPLGQKIVEDTFGAMYNETYADEQLIVLTLEQVEQLVAIEEAEDVSGPTWYTHVWLKPEGSKGHKNEQGYLEDPRKRWPLLGHARFVDTSAAAVAKIPSGRRSEVCQDEPECEHCLCYTCQHQKACRLDNTLNCCSPCKTSGGAHHHKAVDCEGHVTS